MKPYRILTCDGGGVRGALTAQILAMLEEEVPFIDQIDLFAGTSTGSFIALGLAFGFKPKDLVGFYQLHGREIFTPYPGGIDPLSLRPKYDNVILKQIMEMKIFPSNPTLADLPKKVVVPSFQLNHPQKGCWAPVYFDNFDEMKAKEYLLIDVALRSGAAPIYFPSYQGYIDGGVASNNPSMVALARALDEGKGNQDLLDLHLLSLGTGVNQDCIPEDVKWGAAEWVVLSPLPNPPTPRHPLFSIISDGIVDVPHYQCQQILKKNYHRLNPILGQSVALDDWQKIPLLLEIAKRYPEENPSEWEALKKWVSK